MERKYLVIVLFVSSVFSFGQNPDTPRAGTPAVNRAGMSHEEVVVRTAYARLSFAVQVDEVHRAIAEARGSVGQCLSISG
jgi:hypothetical protein